jgi:hypothetical protein
LGGAGRLACGPYPGGGGGGGRPLRLSVVYNLGKECEKGGREKEGKC